LLVGGLLSEATERLEREAFFVKAARQLEQLRRRDPAGWEATRAESRSWQHGTDQDTLTKQDEPGWWE
jgi:hypothetical protein